MTLAIEGRNQNKNAISVFSMSYKVCQQLPIPVNNERTAELNFFFWLSLTAIICILAPNRRLTDVKFLGTVTVPVSE